MTSEAGSLLRSLGPKRKKNIARIAKLPYGQRMALWNVSLFSFGWSWLVLAVLVVLVGFGWF